MDTYGRKWYRLKSILRDRLLCKPRKNGKPVMLHIQEYTLLQVLELMEKIEDRSD